MMLTKNTKLSLNNSMRQLCNQVKHFKDLKADCYCYESVMYYSMSTLTPGEHMAAS